MTRLEMNLIVKYVREIDNGLIAEKMDWLRLFFLGYSPSRCQEHCSEQKEKLETKVMDKGGRKETQKENNTETQVGKC